MIWFVLIIALFIYRNGDVHFAQFLCVKSLSLVNSLGEKSRTPLHLAVLHNSVAITALLLKFGADVEKRFVIYCLMPLLCNLCSCYLLQCVKQYLLYIGKAYNAFHHSIGRDGSSMTPLECAANKNYAIISKILIKNGAQVNRINSRLVNIYRL